MKVQRHIGELAAAHRLMNHGGDCELLHGHNWDLTVWIEAPVDEVTGIAVDFLEFDDFRKSLWNDLDHGVWLNERDPLAGVLQSNSIKAKLTLIPCEPTAENMAALIVHRLAAAFPQALRCGVCLGEMHGCTAEITLSPQPSRAAS